MVKRAYLFRNHSFFRQVELATTPSELRRGLLGRTSAGNGLILQGATAIHMFGMSFPIDAVYINRHGIVIGLEKGLPPNCHGALFSGTRHVVEFDAGTIEAEKIYQGEQWYWEEKGS